MNQETKDAAKIPVVLITGAGSGLGAAMAKRFARAGFKVAVTDIDAGRARQVSDELSGQGATALHNSLDVTSDADWQRIGEWVEQAWGGINVLVNNAGVAASGNCEETTLENWRWVIDVDLMSVVRGCHRFLPGLRQQGAAGHPAHIINIASFAGFSAMPGMSAYGTAKAGVIALSEHLLTELDGSGVGVSVVCPSFVATNLLESFRGGEDSTRKTVERWMQQSPVTADDVAETVFRAMQKGEFIVLTHPKTRAALRLKRFWPSRYYRRISELARKAGGRKS
ncbi:MAG TPA: SDR family oxidoreductase [Xanthomonadales bacterium]|nr:SDR family oxidoreductase [Xanthomonadales bacterium]